ncbi:MAG: hypothetical protein ACK5NG_10410 [Chthoniobacterales bacterium]
MSQHLRPGTILRLWHANNETPNWKNKIGNNFEVLSYSKQDGLEVVWLKNLLTQEIETTDQSDIFDFFIVIKEGSSDYF